MTQRISWFRGKSNPNHVLARGRFLDPTPSELGTIGGMGTQGSSALRSNRWAECLNPFRIRPIGRCGQRRPYTHPVEFEAARRWIKINLFDAARSRLTPQGAHHSARGCAALDTSGCIKARSFKRRAWPIQPSQHSPKNAPSALKHRPASPSAASPLHPAEKEKPHQVREQNCREE
jgi:hypothetical protein